MIFQSLIENPLCFARKILFIAGCVWIFASCSSSKISESRQPEPIQLTEEQRLEYDRDFIDATKLKLFGSLADAASKLTRCTEINPHDAAAYFQLAEIYGMIEDRDNALKNARLSVKYDAKNIWYKMQLANLYVADQQTDSAIIMYRQLAEMQPNNVDLQFNTAMLHLENNEYKEALKTLKKIEKTYGFTEEVAIARYQVYTKKQDLKTTETLLKKCIESFPDELRFYGLLAELYSSTGREPEAQEYYTKLLNVDPEYALGFISMIEFYKDYGNDGKVIEETQRMYDLKTIDPEYKVELFLLLSSDSVFFNKHLDQMNEMVKQLFEKHPDNFRVRMLNADRNLRQRNYEAAKDDLLFITDRMPTNYLLWEQLFYLLNLLQDNETLFESTGKALQYFDDRYLFNFFRGLSASMLKKYDEAVPAYLRTLEYLKKEKEQDKNLELQTYVMLAEAYNETKEFPKSDEAFEKALTLSPNNPLVLNNYGYYLSLREEKLDLAEEYIKRCIASEPNSSTYLDTYGWILYKLGRVDEAIAMIEKAMKNGGADNPEIVDHMCELLVVAGRTDEAYHVCKYAGELNNSQATVEQKIESIRQKK